MKRITIGLVCLALVGCGEDDPTPSPALNNGNNGVNNVNNGNNGNNNGNNGVNNGNNGNNGNNNGNNGNNGVNNGNNGAVCEPLASDYSPGADDAWPTCISDDGEYHRFEQAISSAGRVAGFESIADILWRNGVPSANDFLDAREVYAADEGLDSRVARREDEHYPPVSDGEGGTLRCRDEGVPEMDPDRCVGPARIRTVLNGAFLDGGMGNNPSDNAARIEAALLWFFYVSAHKEATTCTTAAKDCDSSYAYYTGDFPRDAGIGLAGVVRELDPEAHDRIWDGILAVRCWRDLDGGEEASDLETRDRALAQLDTALLYGFSTIVRTRLLRFGTGGGGWAFLQVAGPVLQRAAEEADPDAAAVLAAAWSSEDGTDVDVRSVTDALDTVFPCP